LLRILGFDAAVEFGAVLDTKTKTVLGYHAWGRVTLNGDAFIGETTVHPNSPGLTLATDLYPPSEKYDIQYERMAWFDETQYVEDEAKIKEYENIDDLQFIGKKKVI